MGAYLMDGLRRRCSSHAIVGDIRGKGLLIGIELVTDRESKVQLDGALVSGVVDFCKRERRDRRPLRRRRRGIRTPSSSRRRW